VSREVLERAALGLLLAEGAPGWVAVQELVERIGDHVGALSALEGLLAVGLAERSGERVRATAAARRFDELGL
jgi:hypothetical protein